MKPFLFVPICAASLIVPVSVLATGGTSGFDGVVGEIESQYHVHAERVPFLGLVNLMAGRASHGGVHNVRVAEFDNFTGPLDSPALEQVVEEKLGAGWERVIRESSHNGESKTLVFMRPEGDRMGMFVVDADGRELDVVQVSVDPHHLNESLDKYAHTHAKADSGESD